MNGFGALIARIVISLALSVAIAIETDSQFQLIEFLAFWIALYVIVSMYYHIRRMLREIDKEAEGVLVYRGNFLISVLLSYVIIPMVLLSLYFVGIPFLVSLIFSERLKETVQMIVGFLLMAGVIIYDVYRAKEDLELRLPAKKVVSNESGAVEEDKDLKEEYLIQRGEEKE